MNTQPFRAIIQDNCTGYKPQFRILSEQSFTISMLLLTAASAIQLG